MSNARDSSFFVVVDVNLDGMLFSLHDMARQG